jgi:hypothetical protein
VESLLGEAEASTLETRVLVRKGHNFSFYRRIALKVLQEFPQAVFLVVDMESLRGESEFLSFETRVPVRMAHNFWSDCWIALKFLLEFPEAVFLVVDVESLLGSRSSRSSRLEYRFERAITFDPTVGSPLNFYRSFRNPFSL